MLARIERDPKTGSQNGIASAGAGELLGPDLGALPAEATT